MVLVLLEHKFETGQTGMQTTDIAKAIRARKLYLQRGGALPAASQVGSRARQYPALFEVVLAAGKRQVILRDLPRR
jgi:hypothetical protein